MLVVSMFNQSRISGALRCATTALAPLRLIIRRAF